MIVKRPNSHRLVFSTKYLHLEERRKRAVAEIPKDGFTIRDELFAWLRDLPDQKRNCVVAIAVRAAHRIVPFLCGPHGSPIEDPTTRKLILDTFRYNLIARALVQYSELKNTGYDFTPDTIDLSPADIFDAFRTCYAAADVAFLSNRIAAPGRVYQAITEDAILVENGIESGQLLKKSLWSTQAHYFHSHVPNFYSMLISLNTEHKFGDPQGNWNVWISWFQPLISGLPAFELPEQIAKELEIRIALGDGRKDFWNRKPEFINTEISEWLKEARKKVSSTDDRTLVQDIHATTFGATDEGKIDRLPVPPEQRLLDTPEQRRAYIDIRNDCISILSQGANQLGACEVQFKTLREVMPEDFSQAAVYDFWRAVNRLRRTQNAHKSIAANIEPHPAKLEPSIAVELEGFLSEVNNFSFADPKIRERDINAIAPQDRVKLDVERALGDQLAKNALTHEGLTTQPAHQSLKDEEENAAGAHDDEHGVQAKEQSNIVRRNFLSAAIMGAVAVAKSEGSFAFREFRGGAYKQAGGATMIAAGAVVTAKYPAVVQYVVENIGALIDYAAIYNNPGVVEFLNWLKAHFGK
jgi:hypothetical protein